MIKLNRERMEYIVSRSWKLFKLTYSIYFLQFVPVKIVGLRNRGPKSPSELLYLGIDVSLVSSVLALLS